MSSGAAISTPASTRAFPRERKPRTRCIHGTHTLVHACLISLIARCAFDGRETNVARFDQSA